MLRKLFNAGNAHTAYGPDEVGTHTGTSPSGSPETMDGQPQNSGPSPAPIAQTGFDEIYRSASTKVPANGWGILKLREMAESPHLAGMNTDMKRNAILMALEAAGAKIEDILQDAVLRQRALNEHEQKEESRLHDYEGVKTEQSRAIQAELNRITAQNMARIQANVDEIARQQDNFRAWKKRKTEESDSIANAAALLIPQTSGAAGSNNTLASVLERASAAYR